VNEDNAQQGKPPEHIDDLDSFLLDGAHRGSGEPY
jgi:hypothetical protein